MSLLMVGSFPLMMMMVLMIAVWAERLLDRSDELVPIEESYESRLEKLAPQAGMTFRQPVRHSSPSPSSKGPARSYRVVQCPGTEQGFEHLAGPHSSSAQR